MSLVLYIKFDPEKSNPYETICFIFQNINDSFEDIMCSTNIISYPFLKKWQKVLDRYFAKQK